jgi:hypothetical protein
MCAPRLPPPPSPQTRRAQPKPAASEGESGAATLGGLALPAAPVKVDVNSLPIRAYLDQTVVPILLHAMSQLVKEVRSLGRPLLQAPRVR